MTRYNQMLLGFCIGVAVPVLIYWFCGVALWGYKEKKEGYYLGHVYELCSEHYKELGRAPTSIEEILRYGLEKGATNRQAVQDIKECNITFFQTGTDSWGLLSSEYMGRRIILCRALIKGRYNKLSIVPFRGSLLSEERNPPISPEKSVNPIDRDK